jgi:hypothetical protein
MLEIYNIEIRNKSCYFGSMKLKRIHEKVAKRALELGLDDKNTGLLCSIFVLFLFYFCSIFPPNPSKPQHF